MLMLVHVPVNKLKYLVRQQSVTMTDMWICGVLWKTCMFSPYVEFKIDVANVTFLDWFIGNQILDRTGEIKLDVLTFRLKLHATLMFPKWHAAILPFLQNFKNRNSRVYWYRGKGILCYMKHHWLIFSLFSHYKKVNFIAFN